MAMEDGWTGGEAGRPTPRIRGGSAARPTPPRPRESPTRNTFVSEIGRPLFEGVDLDSHLERFVLDAVDGELPEPTCPATPPPAPKVASPPPPLKPRAAAPVPTPSGSLLPDLGAQPDGLPRCVAAPGKAPQIRGAAEPKAGPQRARVEEPPVQEPEPVEPEVASTAELGVVLEASPPEASEPEPVTRTFSEASGMTVDALPPPASMPPTGTVLSERATAVLGQLRRVPREAWETGAAALLGGIIGYQASSLLMWLLG